MLSKRHKLSHASFPRQKDPKFSWTGETLLIYGYTGGDRNSPPRFAVVVSKKKGLNAVSRNAFKRKVFAAIREKMTSFEQLSFRRYLVFPKGRTTAVSCEEIGADIDAFLADK